MRHCRAHQVRMGVPYPTAPDFHYFEPNHLPFEGQLMVKLKTLNRLLEDFELS